MLQNGDKFHRQSTYGDGISISKNYSIRIKPEEKRADKPLEKKSSWFFCDGPRRADIRTAGEGRELQVAWACDLAFVGSTKTSRQTDPA